MPLKPGSDSAFLVRRLGPLALAVFAFFLLLACSSAPSGSNPADAESVEAKATPPKSATPTPAPTPLPAAAASRTSKPPQLPTVEDGAPSPTVDEILQAGRERQAEKARSNRDQIEEKPGLYRWKDERGVTHISSSLADIPARFQNKAEFIPVSDKPAATRRPVDDYDPQAFRGAMEKQEKEWGSWSERLRAARQKTARLQALLESLENNPPDCGASQNPDTTDGYDPGCEARWRASILQAKVEAESASAEESALFEEARRAGVPPGYLR